jgi:RNA-directed DNA polymerase
LLRQPEWAGVWAETCLRDACKERFDFLGYSFGPHYFPKDGRRYLGASPSKKSVARLKPRISAILRRGNKDPWQAVCEDVNRVLIGWARYFNYGTCTSAYCATLQDAQQIAQGLNLVHHQIA